LSTGNLSITKVRAEPNEIHYWGLIIQAWTHPADHAFEGDAQYMYHLMSDHYGFDGICYLATNPYTNITLPGVTNETTKENINWAITEWLPQNSGPNDVVFIFWATHGFGYTRGENYTGQETYKSWLKYQLDTDGDDEGDEIREITLGFDINEDNDTDDWVGIDETFLVEQTGILRYQNYTDDELRLNLSTVNYDKLIFVSTSCFSGGLIDDLSAPNRIIITTTNETSKGGGIGTNYMHPWVSHLMDALHGEDVYWNPTTRQLIHNGTIDDADSNEDGQVSLKEAWDYAWDHDENRPEETPWLDDNNNSLPTYVYESDVNDTTDGNLANVTCIPYRLKVRTCKTSGSEISGKVNVWIDGNLEGIAPVEKMLSPQYEQYHNVTVEPTTIILDGYEYRFSSWEDGSNANSRNVSIDHSSRTITAYYHIQGGGGCPFVSSWNGTGFVIDNNLLPNSAKSGGTEVEDYYKLEQSLVPVGEWNDQSIYPLLISEFQQEHSYLDQAKLITADHNSNINVAVSPSGEILTYQNPNAPLSAVDDQGYDWIETIHEIDEFYYEGYDGSCLLLNFGVVEAENAKLIVRADRPPVKTSIYIQVLNSTDNWVDVVSFIPRTYWATEIVDLSSYLSSTGEFKVRLYFTDSHKVDFVGLDTTAQEEIDIEEALLLLAYHSDDGVVTTKLRTDDDVYAELVPEQQITLLFAATTQNAEQRTFIIYVKGYYITLDN